VKTVPCVDDYRWRHLDSLEKRKDFFLVLREVLRLVRQASDVEVCAECGQTDDLVVGSTPEPRMRDRSPEPYAKIDIASVAQLHGALCDFSVV
jgi:hypothetical protein